ncbi:MAG: ATP-binding cassette domain-containing protein [Clostridium sp.]|nr:ATP-binding cassette domain-containing protein [Clostridium sp.]
MEILTVKNLTFYYPETEEPAIDHFSLSINAGDFFVLFGRSGCGKSTLLRHLKPQLTPHGIKDGKILFNDTPLNQLSELESASKIGFVMQSPDNQIVTDKVWHELAFGLESLGYDTPSIRRRVAEMASFFGIQNWFYKNVSELSGGQKQLLNLASVMVMQPSLLILDEPTSQLDPIAASDFLNTLKKINQELGTTIILTEHRLEEALSIANHAAIMEDGRLLCSGNVTEVCSYLKQNNHNMFLAMPTATRIWGSVPSELPCPVSVKDGRSFLKCYTECNKIKTINKTEPYNADAETKISVNNAWFRYEKNLPDIIKGVNLTAKSGELFCILGGNGTGKTTLLKLIAGCHKPYDGEINTYGKVCLLPQNPQTLFVKKTVWEDLEDVVKHQKISKEQRESNMENVLKLCQLSELAHRHPYDLSGGEQQRAALAKLLLLKPDILLMDEPTKGFDAAFKYEFSIILKELLTAGVCIIMVSHDIEFCAEYANRCALFFDGSIVSNSTPKEFFNGNSFYTTSANRIARDIIPDAVTTEDVIDAIGGKSKKPMETVKVDYKVNINKKNDAPKETDKLPIWRKIGAGISALLALCTYFIAAKNENLNEILDFSGITNTDNSQFILYAVFMLFIILTAIFSGRKSSPPVSVKLQKNNRKLSKRTITAVIMIILLIPLTLFIGTAYVDAKQYYLTTLAVLIECMLPFFMVFEGRKPKSRELVIIAVLCAINIAGRATFFMFPQFKPIIALTIISGVALGGETGFLVGAVTMLISNMMFAQGPWTPWQMFAMGIIGFLAGILYQKGWLKRSRISLSVFGAISAIIIYGGIMNPASALIWSSEALNWNIIISYYVTGLPLDCIQAIGTVVFLWIVSEPMLEKLDRIKVKYGLVE